MPQESSSSALLRSYSVYTLARLKADPAVAELAVGLDKAQASLGSAAAASQQAGDAYVEALAARDAADTALDAEVIKTSLAALVACGNRRDAASYRRLFPDGANALTTLPAADEIAAVKLLEGRLGEEPAESPAKASLAALAKAREAMEAAVVLLQSKTLAQSAARSVELTAREEWRRVVRKVFGELTVRFPDDRRRVESYFRATRTVHADEPEPVTPSAPVA